MLFDTDVLIWVLRGHRGAAATLEATEDRLMSAVTYMEIARGARDRQHLREIRAFVDDLALQALPLLESIGERAIGYIEDHGLRTGFDIPDALIAATAVEHGLALCTGNTKHYRPIPGLVVRAFRP